MINPLLTHGPPGRIPPYSVPPQHSSAMYGSAYGNGNSLMSQYPPPTYVPRNRGMAAAYGGPNNLPVHPGFGGSLMAGALGGGGGNVSGGPRGHFPAQTGKGFVPQGLYALYNNNGDSGRQRRVQDRGGQLQVGGVVVGSWGANYGPGSGLGQQTRISRTSLLGPAAPPPRVSSDSV